ncbi:MAG: hypothetical protein KDJ81_03430, partial [Rhodobacteraceae bacterium]|nr:hypothetical protein [Paracoccaceae bacterium]
MLSPGDRFGLVAFARGGTDFSSRIWQVTDPRAPACPRAGATSAPAQTGARGLPTAFEIQPPSAFALA